VFGTPDEKLALVLDLLHVECGEKREKRGESSPRRVIVPFTFSSGSSQTILCLRNRAVGRLSEQTRQVSRAPKVQVSSGVWGHAPKENLKIYSL